MTTDPSVLPNEAICAAKEAVATVGYALGNLMHRIYLGNVHKVDWTDEDRKKATGTTVFFFGGSIGTLGYTRHLLPLIAHRRLVNIDPDFARNVRIFTPYMESSHAGAFGAYFLALPEEVKKQVTEAAQRSYSRHKVPILPLLDIGGTKISLVLAYLDPHGQLTLDIFQSHRFATPISEPEIFYPRLASFLAAPLTALKSDGLFELVPVLAVGQPGRFADPKGVIGPNTAKDLGPTFAGCNPSSLFAQALREEVGDIDVYCANDGRSQFLGIGVLTRKREAEWSKLHGCNVAYLGLGTGLGAGFGHIDENGYVMPYSMHNAFDIMADEDHERLPVSRYTSSPVVQWPYPYGDVLSGKFFRHFMHAFDLERIKAGRTAVFLPHSSARHLPPDQARTLLSSDERVSPLNAGLANEILQHEVVTAQTEEIVERSRPELENLLRETLHTVADELDGVLLPNVRKSDYSKVIEAVAQVKRRRRRVVFIGIGKSHLIGRNLAYIYSNLGINSDSCELTGANSENLTNLREDDLVFLISNSGRAVELLQLVRSVHDKHCHTVALTGDPSSPLADNCTYQINAHVNRNPNPIAEAPTTSTTNALAAGTAIGMVVSYLFDYDPKDFFKDHPNLQFNVDFPVTGVRADTSFDRLTKIEDIFRRFAASIRDLLDDDGQGFTATTIALTKRILVSHYNGRTVFFTGAGSSLRVAEKIAATLTSIGIDASCENSAQLSHGDFARVKPGDLLVFISFSGETRHLLDIRGWARQKGVDCAVITARRDSRLAQASRSDICLIAGEGADDTDLVAIPDQKILSSFINLTVGDALAVILCRILGRTSKDFAEDAHAGGEIARGQARLPKPLLNQLGQDMADQIAANSDQLEEVRRGLYFRIAPKHLHAYVLRNSRPGSADVMIIGMGGIGLAYLAPMFSEAGKTIWFVEANPERIGAMRRIGFQYRVRRVGPGAAQTGDRAIGRVSVLASSDLEAVTAYALRADTIVTCIGVANIDSLLPTLADIVRVRYVFRLETPLNVVFSENFPVEEDPLATFRHRLREELANPELKVYFDAFVGLVPGIDEAIVPEVGEESLDRPLLIEADSAPLFMDRRQWCTRSRRHDHAEATDFGGHLVFTERFLPLHMRKLWVHNMAHALIGYLGHVAGHQHVYDAIMDERIKDITLNAMRAIGHELYRRWSYAETPQPTLDAYIDWRWSRYENKALGDSIPRLCRDPERKLKRDDRLIGAANYVRRHAGRSATTDQAIVDILTGAVAAIQYASTHGKHDARALRAQVLADLIDIDSALLNRADEQLRSFKRANGAGGGRPN